MLIRNLMTAGLILLALLASYATGVAGTIAVWPVDPQEKVFRDTQPGATGAIALHAAKNEFESAQCAFRCGAALKDVRVEVSPLTHVDGNAKIDGANIAWNFVGYVPIDKNTPGSDVICVRKAPCEIPDPLLEDRSVELPADQSQPVWLTVYVPKNAAAGMYRGTVRIVSGDVQAELPIELTVDAFTLSDDRHLWVTNWFTVDTIAKAHKVELWSEPFWTILQRYAENMAAHRQNVVYTPWSLVNVFREPDGKLTFDYGKFDRFVELFEKAGAAEQIEITHLGSFGPVGWDSGEMVFSVVSAVDRQSGKHVELPRDEGILRLVADLQRHLKERGWLAKTMIHVADEPSIQHVAAYRRLSEQVHKAAPDLRRIDAIETPDLGGALEVWVPKLSHFNHWREAFESHRAGNEFWYYICCHPYGNNYPNRFLDIPTSRVRVLHWINFAEDLKGYLHWGGNFWGSNPFGTPSAELPPGDTHVIYPGREGPLNSIRWEIERESAEDFEYLHLLTAKTDALKQQLGEKAVWIRADRRAKELCRQVLPSLAEPESDPKRIAAVRRQIADEILALDASPMLLVETEPAAGSTLVNGPVFVEVRGLTTPGATVKVNGKPVSVSPEGRFACGAHPDLEGYSIGVEAEANGQKKSTLRSFHAVAKPTNQ